MKKREYKFQKISESQARLSVLPLYTLKSLLNRGYLKEDIRLAINEIIRDKEKDNSVNSEISQSFLNGDKIKKVNFSLNDYIKIINGFERDKFGSVIALVSLIPEPIYLIEIDGNDGDIEIPQSSIRIAK
ncbi:MAG: hypothetical protein WAU11_09680 [Ignavibacteriaceae bacterium]